MLEGGNLTFVVVVLSLTNHPARSDIERSERHRKSPACRAACLFSKEWCCVEVIADCLRKGSMHRRRKGEVVVVVMVVVVRELVWRDE